MDESKCQDACDRVRKPASVQTVSSIVTHPDADRLELATVLGWQVVIAKGEAAEGAKVVYFEIDSKLPGDAPWLPPAVKARLEKQKKNKKWFRVKAARIRGQISQGLIVSMELTEEQLDDGYDMTHFLGIDKHEKQVKVLNKPKFCGWKFLHKACWTGNLESAKFAIENGFNVNVVDRGRVINRWGHGPFGETPLHKACFKGYVDLAKLLIENGADLNAKDNNGKTPFHRACGNGWGYGLEVAKLLIENGADFDAKDRHGKAPLHVACANNHLRIVSLLIKNGDNVDTKFNWYGYAPLHEACQKGKLELVQLLLSLGANVNAESTLGTTPLQVGSENNQTEVVWFLVRQFPWLVSERLE